MRVLELPLSLKASAGCLYKKGDTFPLPGLEKPGEKKMLYSMVNGNFESCSSNSQICSVIWKNCVWGTERDVCVSSLAAQVFKQVVSTQMLQALLRICLSLSDYQLYSHWVAILI